jgi:hypothetical protein
MRKLTVGLVVLGLFVALAGPVMAQVADPLGLITSGAVLPYFSSGGSVSLLEAYAPIQGVPRLHGLFYDVNCRRGPESIGVPLTRNDVQIVPLPGATANAANGLIALGNVDNTGFFLEPMQGFFGQAIVARVIWFNLGSPGFVRTLEPIQIVHAEALPINGFIWNPLRTAAVFEAPRYVTGSLETNLIFICPRNSIQATVLSDGVLVPTSDFENNTPAFPAGNISGVHFPTIDPNFNTHASVTRFRVYDLDERFLRDVSNTCDCITTRSLTQIASVYADAVEAPLGTYTEVEAFKSGTFSQENAQPFMLYRQINAFGVDLFGRASGAHRLNIDENSFFPIPLAR